MYPLAPCTLFHHTPSGAVYPLEQWILLSGAGMGKEYTIPCIDSDVLQAMVEKDDMPICAIAQASGLSKYALRALTPQKVHQTGFRYQQGR